MSIVPSTIAATQGAREGQAGLASGLVNTRARSAAASASRSSSPRDPAQLPSDRRRGVGQPVAHGRLQACISRRGGPRRRGAAGHAARRPGSRGGAPIEGARHRRHVAAIVAIFAAGDIAFGNSKGAPLGAYKLADTYSYISAPGCTRRRSRTTCRRNARSSRPATSHGERLRPQLPADEPVRAGRSSSTTHCTRSGSSRSRRR